MEKKRKPEMPAGEPGHIADPGPDNPAENPQLMEGVFRALLDWDLRVSFKSSPVGKLYTVYTLATDDEDGERDELLTDADARRLSQWVANRKTRQLYRELPVGVTLLMGAPMAGKTFAALQLARAATNGGPVIYAALEDQEPVLRERIRYEMGPEDADELIDMTILSELPRIGAEPGALDVLEHHLAEMRPALIVLDSLAYIRPDTVSEDEASQAALDQLQALASKHRVRFIVVHHIKESTDLVRLSAVVSATLRQRPGCPPTVENTIDPDVAKGFDVLTGALKLTGDIPLYMVTDSAGQVVLEGATPEDLRRWTNPPPDGTWPAELRVKAALTRLAGLYLDLATLRRDILGLAELAKGGQSGSSSLRELDQEKPGPSLHKT